MKLRRIKNFQLIPLQKVVDDWWVMKNIAISSILHLIKHNVRWQFFVFHVFSEKLKKICLTYNRL